MTRISPFCRIIAPWPAEEQGQTWAARQAGPRRQDPGPGLAEPGGMLRSRTQWSGCPDHRGGQGGTLGRRVGKEGTEGQTRSPRIPAVGADPRPPLTGLLRMAPAGDPDGLAGGEGVVGRGQADGPDGGAVLHRPVQLQQRDVVVVGEVVEERVHDDALQPALLHPRGATLALVMQAQVGRPYAVFRVPAAGSEGPRGRPELGPQPDAPPQACTHSETMLRGLPSWCPLSIHSSHY